MKSSTKTLLFIGIPMALFIGFFIVFLGSIIFIFTLRDHRIGEVRKKQTAETIGTVYGSSENFDHDSTGGGSIRCELRYEYIVNGKSYSGSNSQCEKRKGVKGKVCYEPANPENSSFSLLANDKCPGN